jgi:hypothetical protein
LAAFLVLLAIGFPPMRQAGAWTDELTGAAVSPEDSRSLDRWYFGYAPSYRWLGQWGAKEDVGCIVTLYGKPPSRLQGARWELDWLAILVQGILMILLVLPFARSSNRENGRGSVAAADRSSEGW